MSEGFINIMIIPNSYNPADAVKVAVRLSGNPSPETKRFPY